MEELLFNQLCTFFERVQKAKSMWLWWNLQDWVVYFLLVR